MQVFGLASGLAAMWMRVTLRADVYKRQYPNRVRGGWLSTLINAGEGVDVDLFLQRELRSRVLDKVAQRIRLNRTKMKSMQDTSTCLLYTSRCV